MHDEPVSDEEMLDATAELIRLRYHSRLSQRQIALATGVKTGVVTGWLRGTRHPRGLRARRLLVLTSCVEELSRFLPPDQVSAWLARPVAEGQPTPLELIAAGDEQVVVAGIADFGRARAS